MEVGGMIEGLIEIAKQTIVETSEVVKDIGKSTIDEVIAIVNNVSIEELETSNVDDVDLSPKVDNVDIAAEVNFTHVEGNYTYKIDELGRPVNVSGKIELADGERNQYAQLKAGGTDRLTSDDGGHIIAREFGGSGEIHNLVPMDSTINRSGEYRQLETTLKNYVNEGYEVDGDFSLEYEAESLRPKVFDITYTVDGEHFHEIIYNKVDA